MIIAIHGLMTYRSVSEFLFGSQSYTNKKQRIQNDVSGNIRYFGKHPIKLHGCDNMKISSKRCEKLQWDNLEDLKRSNKHFYRYSQSLHYEQNLKIRLEQISQYLKMWSSFKAISRYNINKTGSNRIKLSKLSMNYN